MKMNLILKFVLNVLLRLRVLLLFEHATKAKWVMRMTRFATLLQAACVIGMGGNAIVAVAAEGLEPPLKSEELFQLTNVWNAHLTFTLDQWNAMEPKGSENFFHGP